MTQVQDKLMTAEELFNLADDGRNYELIEGILIEMAPPGGEHGVVPTNATALLAPYLKRTKAGLLVTETGFLVQRNPDVVRSADLAFVSRASLEQEPLHPKYRVTPPDLAVEVVSPNDLPKDVRGKVTEWLAAGSREVWVFVPKTIILTKYQPGGVHQRYEAQDTFTSDLFPGWRCTVEELLTYLS